MIMIMIREAVEEAEYTAYMPDTTPMQYSPDVYIQAKEKSGRITSSNITLPFVTEGPVTAPSPPPLGLYEPGDQKDIEIIYVADGIKSNELSHKERRSIITNVYAQLPPMLASTVFSVEEIEDEKKGRVKLEKLIKELIILREEKIHDNGLIKNLNKLNIKLSDKV